MSENPVLEKSYLFALRVIRLYKYLSDEKREFVLSRQLLGSGTNVGAHVKAAQEAETRPDFFHEMNIALQQASRTEYWLQLLHDGGFLADHEFNAIHSDCVEVLKLLKSITKPVRENRQPTPKN